MLNNYIGGGQIFLHKIRMFLQVFWRSITMSGLIGIVIGICIYTPILMKEDLNAALTYRKALLADAFDDAMNSIKRAISRNPTESITLIDARTSKGIYGKNLDPRHVMNLGVFRQADKVVMELLIQMGRLIILGTLGAFILIFTLWWRFGKSVQSDHKIKGGQVMNESEVGKILRSSNKASTFKIGKMPLVRDMETRHFLITGSTGSGKTNLIDQLLPQVASKGQPAIVIDQTGEMISKYYDANRGDIIFNPLDDRTHHWDFWADCFSDNLQANGTNDRLEKFAKILFGFNRKNGSNSDPFWENSAEVVFTSCVEHLYSTKNRSMAMLQTMLQKHNRACLSEALANTPAGRYLSSDNKITANSILSVMTTSTRPLNYLRDAPAEKCFSLIRHLDAVKNGSKSWLFLATKPSQRELTLPLTACLTELAVSLLMENGISKEQRLWFVLDELAALGKLPALAGLMSEGRKYGACVVAAMQSLNQLYLNYGQYAGSTIFGQFGSKFFFRNDEPLIAKMISDMCGMELIGKQQKNTSFGANEFRDGVSYTEQEKQKKLVEYSDIAGLDVGECYVLLPEPKVRLAKLKVPESKQTRKNPEFVPHAEAQNTQIIAAETRDSEDDSGQQGQEAGISALQMEDQLVNNHDTPEPIIQEQSKPIDAQEMEMQKL